MLSDGPGVGNKPGKGDPQSHKRIKGYTFNAGRHTTHIPGKAGVAEAPHAAQDEKNRNIQEPIVQHVIHGKIKRYAHGSNGAQHHHRDQGKGKPVIGDMGKQNISTGAKVHRRHLQLRRPILVIGYGQNTAVRQIPDGSITVDLGTHLVITGKRAVIKAIDLRVIEAHLNTVQRGFGGYGSCGGNGPVHRHPAVLPKGDLLIHRYRHRTAAFHEVPAAVQRLKRIKRWLFFGTEQPKNHKKAGDSNGKRKKRLNTASFSPG